MKILMVITELGPGGAERIVYDLSRELICRAHSITVVSLQKKPQVSVIPDLLAALNIKVIYLSGTKKDITLPWKLRRVIRQEKPDVIHAHLIHANLLSRLAAAGTGIPLADTVHIAERRPGKQIFFILDRLTSFLADAHIAVSHAAAEYHEKCCHLPRGTFQVIYNASDAVTPASPAAVQKMVCLYGLDSYNKIIGSVGRLNYQKGYDWFLKHLYALAKQIPHGERWAVLIFGDGPEQDNLKDLADQINQQYDNIKVILPGYRADAASFMVMLDVFVMPSRYEGYGLALTEAMSLGLPVVCHKIDSLPELCQLYRGHSFLFEMRENDPQFEQQDAAAMAEAVIAAADCPKTDGQVLMTGDGMVMEYLQIYEKICQKN